MSDFIHASRPAPRAGLVTGFRWIFRTGRRSGPVKLDPMRLGSHLRRDLGLRPDGRSLSLFHFHED